MTDTYIHNDLAYHTFCMFGPMLGIPELYFYVSHDCKNCISYMVQTCLVTVEVPWAV